MLSIIAGMHDPKILSVRATLWTKGDGADSPGMAAISCQRG